MPHPRLLSAFLASLLTFSMPSLGPGQEPEAHFDKKLADDFEPAALIEDSSTEDGSLAVIFVARKKNLKPAKWPSIIPGVSINATSLLEEDGKYTVENWIVSTKDKKRLGVVKSSEEYFRPYYNGQNHHSLAVLWGPEQEGWRYGVINYCGRSGAVTRSSSSTTTVKAPRPPACTPCSTASRRSPSWRRRRTRSTTSSVTNSSAS